MMMPKAHIRRLLFVLAICALPAQAQVRATVSSTSVSQHEPLTLTLESDSVSPSPPDLSVLEQDFRIVGRSTGRSTRTFNGRTSQRTTVRLTLIPKRSGDLVIPPVSFGQESSKSINITVLAALDEGPNLDVPPAQGFPGADPGMGLFLPPQQGAGQGYSPMQDWAGMGVTPPWGGFPQWGEAGTMGMPDWTAAPEEPGLKAQPEPVAPPPPAEPETDYWPWFAGALLGAALTLAAVALWRRLKRAGKRATPTAAPAPPPPEEEPRRDPASFLDAVRRAYQANDPYAAKEALLQWAAAEWPANPPTNLSRMAARCPPECQRWILRLDEALYSPEPVTWNDRPVWERLRELTPEEPELIPGDAKLAHSGS